MTHTRHREHSMKPHWRSAIVVALVAVVAHGADWLVAPGGTTEGDGSAAERIDIHRALGGKSPARPGDTI